MDDETLTRYANIIATLYHGEDPVAPWTDDESHVAQIRADLAALVAAGHVVREDDALMLSEKAFETMEAGMRMHTPPPDWSHVTLADCAAWAEAIVVACEANRWRHPIYTHALYMWRALAARVAAEHPSIESLQWFSRAEARAGQPRIARAYAAIIAVRMLAAEAAEREGR